MRCPPITAFLPGRSNHRPEFFSAAIFFSSLGIIDVFNSLTGMKPILYSFRRCPYAMRARLAIKASGIQVQLREVVLRDKPAEMLAISPKGSVPVLGLSDGRVIDESIDILWWALEHNDPEGWIDFDSERIAIGKALVERNDTEFKIHLDRYKYPERYLAEEGTSGQLQLYHRQKGGEFLQELEARLNKHGYLLDERVSFADIAIFPFMRQFAHVDSEWFYGTDYCRLQRWLKHFLDSELFQSVMGKYKAWEAGDPTILF